VIPRVDSIHELSLLLVLVVASLVLLSKNKQVPIPSGSRDRNATANSMFLKFCSRLKKGIVSRLTVTLDR